MQVQRFEDDTRELQVQCVRAADGAADQRAYLRAMYGFVAPLEEIFAADTILDHPLARRRAPRLLRELRALGDHAPPPWCTDLPDASTLARRLGIAYVVFPTSRFAAIAEQLLVTQAAEDAALIAARETFEKLIAWLSRASG